MQDTQLLPISTAAFDQLVAATKLTPAATAFALLQVNGARASTIAAVRAARIAQLSEVAKTP